MWCSYGGFFAEPAFSPGSGPPEDEDEFAKRIWQEMERRKQQQSGSAAAAARSYFSAQTKAEAARQQAAFEAAQRSRQILEEEKAKDRAWREAVLKVLLGLLLVHSFALLSCVHVCKPMCMSRTYYCACSVAFLLSMFCLDKECFPTGFLVPVM